MTAPQPKPWILDIAPYIPGKSKTDDGRKVAKLSSNENPLGTSDAARAAFARHAHDLERYPDASAADLREAIAAANGLDPARIIYGTGSDEVLHLAAGTFAGAGDEIIFVKYGFAVYEIATRRVGAVPVIAPDKDYATDVDAILACVTDKTRVVFVANPNNPTGTYSPKSEIARLHAALPEDVLLVLDHAYAEYLAPEDDDGGMELARTAANVLRDKYRHPAETLDFFGVRPNHTVVEIWPGGGWYTEILAPFLKAGGGTYYAVAPEWGRSGITKLRDSNAALYGAV